MSRADTIAALVAYARAMGWHLVPASEVGPPARG